MKNLRYLIYATFFIACSAVWGEVVLVVAKDSPLNGIKSSEVKKLFLGKSNSLGGKTYFPALLKKGSAHSAFLKKHVNRLPSQFARTWQKLVFTGKAKMPKSFSSEAELIDYLSNNPNSIGYINKTSLSDKVKTLKVN